MDDEIEVMVTMARYQGGTVAEAFGYTATGRPVKFAGDPRLIAEIAETILLYGEPVYAAVPIWAILGGWTGEEATA